MNTMSINVNTAFVTGMVACDPQVRVDAKNQKWANFRLVRRGKEYNCSAKGSTAEHIEKVVRGGDSVMLQYHLDDYSKGMSLFVDFVHHRWTESLPEDEDNTP